MFKIYIWHRIDNLTTHWHSGGALVIITDRDPQDAWYDEVGRHQRFSMDDEPIIQELPEPDLNYTLVGAGAEEVYIYEDSGCC